VDQTLIQGFQDIDLDVAQPEAGRLPGDADDQVATVGEFENPVEKVALDGALDPDLVEGAAGENGAGILGRKVEHAARDRLGDDGQVGVLQEQRIIADRCSIGLAQQPIPELPLQNHLRMSAKGGPEALQDATGTAEAEAASAELALDSERIVAV